MDYYNRRSPRYLDDDSDFSTNAESYYKDLARKQRLIKLLSERIWEYENTLNLTLEEIENRVSQRFLEWDKRIEQFPDNVESLLEEWLLDGTLDHIINDTIFNSKADKIDLEETETRLQIDLEETETRLQNVLKLRSYPKYGTIDFSKYEGLNHNIDFNLWRDPIDGKIKHDWTLDDTGYSVRYINKNGSTSNDGLTVGTSWGSLADAFSKVENDSSLQRVKFVMTGIFSRTNILITTSTTLTKKYIIESEFPIGENQLVSGYSLHTGSVMVAPCAYAVMGVVRGNEKDLKGCSLQYKKAQSLADCEQTPDSYFSNGALLYVNRLDTTRDNTLVIVQAGLWQFRLSASCELIFNDFNLLKGGSSQGLYFESDSGTAGKVIFNKVNLQDFSTSDTSNGFATNGIADIKLFNCGSFDSARDGFNYHNSQSIDGGGTVFEYNCYAENVGKSSTLGNNNISTAHEGLHVIRIGTKGTKSQGPLIADVMGCYSLLIDCFVDDTRLIGTTRLNSAFYFDDSVGPYITNPNGKAWLINCGGGTATEWGINGDEFFRNGKITVDNFTGSNVPEDVVLNIL